MQELTETQNKEPHISLTRPSVNRSMKDAQSYCEFNFQKYHCPALLRSCFDVAIRYDNHSPFIDIRTDALLVDRTVSRHGKRGSICQFTFRC